MGDVPTPDEIINGGKRPSGRPPGHVLIGPNGEKVELTEDQAKAISLILARMPFVFIGINPTENGADFFTAMHGDPTALRNAKLHLPMQIEKLYRRKEIV